MLHDDITGLEKSAIDSLNTRALKKEVVRHHKNNPQSSMEAAFEYIMLNSATFRALPAACIAKARRCLALPTAGIKPKQVTSECKPSLFFVTQNEITPIGWTHIISDDSVDALKEPTKKPDGHIPFNGQQTVDYLIGLTTDLVSICGTSIHGTTSHTISFNSACDRLGQLKNLRMEDVIEARKMLGMTYEFLESLGMPLYSVEFMTGVPQAEYSSAPKKEPIKPCTTVVHAERVVVDNKKMIKILEFENVQKLCELPNKYCAHFPYFYALSDRSYIGICINLTQSYRMKVGEVITIKEFGQMIKTMKKAGVRLSKINKTAKLEKEHSGKFTVSV